jgi:hypothetical protein
MRPTHLLTPAASFAVLALAIALSGCTTTATATSSSASSEWVVLADIVADIAWADTVTATVGGGSVEIISNGIPNHERDAQYAVPNGGVSVPDASSAQIVDDPTQEQDYDLTITTSPVYSDTVTEAPLGSIGIMISGSVLFNPYEGDGTTVAMASNFSLTADDGTEVWFVDACTGHPTPMNGEYHYHGLSVCVASQVDAESGASHIIGLALDGFPIYGANDIDGNPVDVADLDECNGITSATPEFPEGIYHYVLPGTLDETSSIRCFHGVVDASQIVSMPPMMGMPGMGGPGARED